MPRYELVLLLDPKTQKKDRDSFLSDFMSIFKDNVLEIDDIGIKNLSYRLGGKAGNDSAYILSYYMDLNNDELEKLQKHFLYNDMVWRVAIFSMTKKQEMWKFDKLQKELEKIIESWDKKRRGGQVSFYSSAKRIKYIDWKAITMLKKYLTRFGDIKPRKYTKNSVKTQKAVRQAIIRARELGVLRYTN